MKIFKIIQLALFLGICIYDALNKNMFCVCWATLSIMTVIDLYSNIIIDKIQNLKNENNL